jgi:hypothetical protein
MWFIFLQMPVYMVRQQEHILLITQFIDPFTGKYFILVGLKIQMMLKL